MNETLPLVSIIVPTFGRPQRLLTAVSSILEQTYPNIEVIVVDDNEPGTEWRTATEKEMSELAGNSVVRYIKRDQNGGGSLARNTGIENARGDFITFLDDDDVYLPNKIEKQLAHLSETKADVSVCDMFFIENGEYKDVKECNAKVDDLATFITEGNSFTPMIMVKKECLNSIHGFHDTPKFQDHLLMVKMLEAGFKVETLKEKLFIHNNHAEQRITLTRRFCEGHKKKINFEMRNLTKLSRKQRKKVLFRINNVTSRINTYENGFLSGLTPWAKSIMYVSSQREFKMIFKTLVRNIVAPQRFF